MMSKTVLCGKSVTAQGRCRQVHLFTSFRSHQQAQFRHATSEQARFKRSSGFNRVVRAAISSPTIPDIEERLGRYEWDRMNLPDLTGMHQPEMFSIV